jgi:hypothetical protein
MMNLKIKVFILSIKILKNLISVFNSRHKIQNLIVT